MNKTYQRIALCSLSVILAAQLSVNLFFADFEISVAVTLLPLFLFLTTDFPLPATTLCAAAGVFLMRLFLSFLRYGDLQAAERLFPEMIFYISYGLLLYLCDRLRQKKAAGYRMLLPFLVGIDYISNLLELLFRAGTDAFHPSTQLGIFLVAVLRTLVIACVLFMHRVMETTEISVIQNEIDPNKDTGADTHEEHIAIPRGVEVYEINGPYFFGIANKFEDVMARLGDRPKVRVIRMRKVPFIDSTGIHNLENLCRMSQKEKITVVLSGVNDKVHRVLERSGFYTLLGEENICPNINVALERAKALLEG